MDTLLQLQSDVEARVVAIPQAHPEWLCGKGCAGCCRRLAEVPQLTAEEWRLLQAGLEALSAGELEEIGRKMTALAQQLSRPVVCPLLDQSTDACRVYAHRPVACRTYGFYRQRELGLYCRDIESQVAAGALDDVVWGNHDAIDARLTRFGGSRALTAWFAEWKHAAGEKER